MRHRRRLEQNIITICIRYMVLATLDLNIKKEENLKIYQSLIPKNFIIL
nr:MAG TPA: hypothetical protein [Caudoviricetes sp.]